MFERELRKETWLSICLSQFRWMTKEDNRTKGTNCLHKKNTQRGIRRWQRDVRIHALDRLREWMTFGWTSIKISYSVDNVFQTWIQRSSSSSTVIFKRPKGTTFMIKFVIKGKGFPWNLLRKRLSLNCMAFFLKEFEKTPFFVSFRLLTLLLFCLRIDRKKNPEMVHLL
jgi:hypothetical protein